MGLLQSSGDKLKLSYVLGNPRVDNFDPITMAPFHTCRDLDLVPELVNMYFSLFINFLSIHNMILTSSQSDSIY